MERKLAAILSADVKGYSLLMGDDEVATVRTITEYREAIAATVTRYGGRVVDAPGDNVLAEFASVVDAVQCAVDIQHELRSRNDALPASRQMQFRIGINLGDVIVEAQRLYGDGVNIAARLESLAEGGGICLSGTAYDQVEGKLPHGFDFLGEHAVKNIARPVRVYRLRLEPGAALLKSPGRRRGDRRLVVGAVIGVLLLLGAGAGWRWLRAPASSGELALPDKPSVAVLPFTNLSQDPAQEYFSDGVTEDLITGLSKVSGLFVIARNSVFTYKGKPVKVREVRRDLGVRYVLEAACSGRAAECGSPPSSWTPPPGTTCGPSGTTVRFATSSPSRTRSRSGSCARSRSGSPRASRDGWPGSPRRIRRRTISCSEGRTSASARRLTPTPRLAGSS